MRGILAGLLAVNTMLAPNALAEEPGERDWCYRLVGVAFVEDGLFHSMERSEDGFTVKLNEEEWESANLETKRALKSCLNLFINVKPDSGSAQDPDSWPENPEGEM